ncbi:MAG: hypothetical protein KDA28_04100, partial [Phycisphaerales bacterium]|nr:hypothetical protein [Phycisphaerales bacterium]
MDPGDGIAFCRGGVFVPDAGSEWDTAACTGDAPCVVRDYVLRWASGDEARPRLSVAGRESVFRFIDSSDGSAPQGVDVSNLHIDGYIANAIEVVDHVDDVTVCGVRIE